MSWPPKGAMTGTHPEVHCTMQTPLVKTLQAVACPHIRTRTHFYNSCSNVTIHENILPNSKICDWVACMHECAQLHVIDSCTSNPHQSSAGMLEKLADQLHQRGLVNFWPKYSSPQSSCHACKFSTAYRDVTELSWHMLDPNGKLYISLENSNFTACLEELSPMK
jgi:hypothetical protein